MKKTLFITTVLFLNIFTGSTQTAIPTSNRYFETQFGLKYHMKLNDFNTILSENSYTPFDNFGMTASLYRGWRKRNLSYSISFNFSTILNDRNAERKVGINEGSVIVDLSYNLLKKKIRLEPLLGIGLGTATLKFVETNNDTTLNTILDGKNNMYREESKLNLIIKTGIKIGFSDVPFPDSNIYPQIQIGYVMNSSNLKWNLIDSPIKRLNGVYAQIGMVKFF